MDGEGASSEVLAMPLAADLRLPRLRDVVRDAEREISVVLDADKFHGDVGAAHTHLQQTTAAGIAAVHREASGSVQPLDQTF